MADREWILLNPGPANTTRSVRAALVMPDLCHREPECFEMMRRCRDGLTRLAIGSASQGGAAGEASGKMIRSASQGGAAGEASGEMVRGASRAVKSADHSDWTAVLFAGSGTASVEAAICSVVPPGRALLAVDNGVYGDRMARIARAHGIHVETVRADIFTPIDPAAVGAVLRSHPEISHVAVVHHETTTGLLNPIAEIARVAAREGRRLIVDAMSSLFGEPLTITAEAIDFVTASANKCLQGIPGVSFVLCRRSAVEALAGRNPRSVYLDLHNHYVQQERDNTPFTPAVQVLHALEQALAELDAEGVARRIARYAENARVLREGMARLGFEILVPEAARSNILTTFRLPAGLAYDPLHDAMKRRGYIIYAGQGDIRIYAFRVSNMGTLSPDDMRGVVAAFAASLEELGVTAGGRSG